MLEITSPMVMGILNVTPDSFSDGGRYFSTDEATRRALKMIEEGVDIIDVGGESTRPGADAVSVETELVRVIPVIQAIRRVSDLPISVDTSTAEVMKQAVDAGASMINDVRALRREGALVAAAESGVPVCLMHMQGDPATMQMNPSYRDLLQEVCDFFQARITSCEQAGISRNQIILDPGFGFGKTATHNLTLINQLSRFEIFGCPLLVGLSRKSTIGKVLGNDNQDRRSASLAGAVVAYLRGASILRVHDVKETVEALKMARAISTESP